MSIKTDIAECCTRRVGAILADRELSPDDKRQKIQDEFERAMERWQKIVLAHAGQRRAER